MHHNKTPSPTLAVIIVSWNVKELLGNCLLSLREELDRIKIPTDVWVVDSASNDNSAEMVREQHPWVHLEACDENLGYVRGNNLVLNRLREQSMPDFVWLLNPDTVMQPGTLSKLLHFFQDHPRAGLIGPKLLNPDGSLQPGAFRFPNAIQPFFDLGYLPQRFYYTRLNGRYPVAAYDGGQPFRVDHPLGAAMLARGAAVQQVGVLDERFFMYCEEIDWAWRMHKAGWEAWLVPEAVVVHHSGASTKQARPETTAYLWESRARLYRKHRSPLTRAIVGTLVRYTFSRMTAESPEWRTTYARIVEAWEK